MRAPGRRLGLALGGVGVMLAVVIASVVEQAPPPVVVTTEELPVADGVVLDAATYRPTDQASPLPALLLAHGFGGDRLQMDAAARAWARRGLVVTTWSARGFGASGGTIGLADPSREIADVSALITMLADDPDVEVDGPGDPRVAVAGGSYGGGTALLSGIEDPRIDAIAAVAAWHDLGRSLAPGATEDEGVWKAQWASLLFTSARLTGTGLQGVLDATGSQLPGRRLGLPAGLDPVCGRFDPDVCAAYAASSITGSLTTEAQAIAERASPAGRLGQVRAPVLLVHGLADDLFGPEEALDNARELDRAGVPVALRFIRSGHGGLGSPDSAAGALVAPWLDHWLGGPRDVDAPSVFGWVDHISGAVQDAPQLPDADGEVLTLQAESDGSLSRVHGNRGPEGGPGRGATMTHPAAGLPASLSALPGVGGTSGLSGLLPLIDVPGQALTFTTSALDEDLVLLGQPQLSVRATAVDTDGSPVRVTMFAKLIDVAPGGRTSLIGATASPVRISAGRAGADHGVSVAMGAVAHRVAAGNRLRLVLATTDQAYAADRVASAVTVQLDGPTSVRLPLTLVQVDPGTPAALGLLAPVGVLILLLIVSAAWVRRQESLMAATISPTSTEPAPAPPGGWATDDEVEVVVRIEGLVKAYADGKVAVDGLDLQVRRGQVFGLLGPNGAGKTTTMRMLLGLATPSSGRIDVLGARIRPGHPLLERVGVLVEGPGFAPHLTGRQNLWSHWRAGARPDAEAAMEEAIEVADLGPAIDRPVRTYSHGMRQRLAISQALLGDPELLILDEPTDGLDPEQIRAMRELLARLGDRGLTILVSSHLLSEVEQMCTHVAVMQQGRIVTAGAIAELVGATRSIVVRSDDRPATRELLVEAYGSDAVTDEADGVAVALDTADAVAPDVVAMLVEAGARVQSVTPRGRLEDAFLALTGSGATRRAEERRAAAPDDRRAGR